MHCTTASWWMKVVALPQRSRKVTSSSGWNTAGCPSHLLLHGLICCSSVNKAGQSPSTLWTTPSVSGVMRLSSCHQPTLSHQAAIWCTHPYTASSRLTCKPGWRKPGSLTLRKCGWLQLNEWQTLEDLLVHQQYPWVCKTCRSLPRHWWQGHRWLASREWPRIKDTIWRIVFILFDYPTCLFFLLIIHNVYFT